METKRKTALITGGTRGIGFGIAKQLARAGFSLALNGIRPEEDVQSVLDDLKEARTDVKYFRGNIALKAEREYIIDRAFNYFKEIHLLVNNAGIAPKTRTDILGAEEGSFDEIISVNLKGPYFLTQAFSNRLIEIKQRKPGFEPCIVTISSVSATVASVNRGDYCLSKAGLAMMTKLFAVRLSEYGIPVYEVRPGIIETDMTSKVRGKYDKLLEEGLCLQNRWGTPDDVGNVVLGIASGLFGYSTGQVFMVDGGMLVERL